MELLRARGGLVWEVRKFITSGFSDFSRDSVEEASCKVTVAGVTGSRDPQPAQRCTHGLRDQRTWGDKRLDEGH